MDSERTEETILQLLYGKSRVGKTKIWQIDAFATSFVPEEAYLRTTYGYLDGKQTTATKTIKGKNIGKSNETTPYEQACSDAQSAWNRKLDSGYVLTTNVPEEAAVELFLPMLAHSYEKRSKHIVYPAHVQPKLDGMRMLARKADGVVTMWSRKGKVIETLEHIRKSLESQLEDGQQCDGEVYVHGWSFQEIIKRVKKLRDDTTELQYHVYDVPVTDLGFEERFTTFNVWESDGVINKVQTLKVRDEEELQEAFAHFLELGYEGAIVRNSAGSYNFGHRSNDLQKLKTFQDAEYEVTGVKSASGRDEGTAVFLCKTAADQEFAVRPQGTRDERRQYYDNPDKYIGQLLTVKFQDLTDDGIPRFPVGLRFRPDFDIGGENDD